MPYSVHLPVFEGPLELLLQLIERNELDISAISLVQVTDQYLQHLAQLQHLEPRLLADFLVVASKLIYLKSVHLLPRPPVLADEEDVGKDLEQQLREYRRFKLIAGVMREREQEGRAYRPVAAPPIVLPPPSDGACLEGIGLEALRDLLQRRLKQVLTAQPLSTVVEPRIALPERVTQLRYDLRQRGRVTFAALLGAETSAAMVVVTFLAVLELLKEEAILVGQDGLFGAIWIEARGL